MSCLEPSYLGSAGFRRCCVLQSEADRQTDRQAIKREKEGEGEDRFRETDRYRAAHTDRDRQTDRHADKQGGRERRQI